MRKKSVVSIKKCWHWFFSEL